MDAYLDAMRRYAHFNGRSSRSQYWLYTLALCLILMACTILDVVARIDPKGNALVITGIVYVAHLLPTIAVTVRRLHDTDRSGWWLLIACVPLVGLITLLVFACTPSTAGANRFGPQPQGNNVQQPSQPMPAQTMPVQVMPVQAVPNHVQPVQTAAAPAPAMVDQLSRLADLRASGALDDGEYQTLKADLLRKSAP